MKSPPQDHIIIFAWTWPFSIADLILGFNLLGTPTTAEHIETVWEKARATGDLPPLERPAKGFSPRLGMVVAGLINAQRPRTVPLAPFAHGKTAREHGGSSA